MLAMKSVAPRHTLDRIANPDEDVGTLMTMSEGERERERDAERRDRKEEKERKRDAATR